jgi:SAM-dependent methyltransferase
VTASPSACPICGGRDAKLLMRGGDDEYRTLPGRTFRFWRCETCGHGRLDPVPTPDQLPRIYPSTYYTRNPRSPVAFAPGRMRELKLRRDVARIVSLAGPDAGRVVDLGCGDAARLERLAELLGPEVDLVGIDLQPDARRGAALEGRVRLLQGNVEEGMGGLEDASCDFVLMSQILEHVRDPLAVLVHVARALAPGGRVLVETPNLGGLDFRLFHRAHWGAYHIPRHFHLFTQESLRRTVEAAGLSMLRRGFLPAGFFIVSLRNFFGLTSIERSAHWAEFLNMRNFPVVAFFTALDLAQAGLGLETSNQYLLAQRPPESP